MIPIRTLQSKANFAVWTKDITAEWCQIVRNDQLLQNGEKIDSQ